MTDEPRTTPTLQVLSERLSELQESVKEHDVIINGNGQAGVKTRLALLENQFSGMDKKINAVMAMLVGMIASGAGITIWFITTVLPVLFGHVGAGK
jgi:hypothetical protein